MSGCNLNHFTGKTKDSSEVSTRVKKIIFVLFACLILLTGCSQEITEGEIYEKEFLPAETRTIILPMIHTNGKSSYTTYVPVTHHYPDRWRISIKSIEKNGDGDYDTAEYYTTEEVFNSCEVGDMFSYDENRDCEEEPVEKSK